jgi:hypothetical protein
LNWEVLGAPVVQSWDEAHLFYDDTKRLYVAIVKHNNPYGRAACLTVSRDFVHWTDPKDCLIFYADHRDQVLGAERILLHVRSEDLLKPVLNRPAEYETDVYALPVFMYEGLYIGMPVLFNHSGDVAGNSDGFHTAELAVSRDLLNWERVGRREKFLPLSAVGGTGTYDTGQIHPARQPILRDNELWFYYSGIRYRGRDYYRDVGKRKVEPDNGAICLAKLRRDGFVSLSAATREGYVLTKPLLFEGKTLHANVDAARGRLRAEILDATTMRPFSGFGLDDSLPLSGDHLDAALRWRKGGDLSQLTGKRACIRFGLLDAHLYSFWLMDQK